MMVGQSEPELARVIESEIAGYRDSGDRCARLMKHTAELADRWIGFATVESISARARVANDLFKALQVSLRMTLDSFKSIDVQTKSRTDLERVVSTAAHLASSCDDSDIEGLVRLLNETFLLNRGGGEGGSL